MSHPLPTGPRHGFPVGTARARLRPSDLADEALAGMTRRPLRSALTMLGTVLGVGALVATLGLTTTAAARISSQFDALKATLVTVQDARPSQPDPAFPSDAEARLRRLNGVHAAGLMWTVTSDEAMVHRSPLARVAPESQVSGAVIAATPGALQAAGVVVRHGRVYDGFAERRGERVALLGAALASQLGIERLDRPRSVFVDDHGFTVMGIIDDVHGSNELLLAVVIPGRTAIRAFGRTGQEVHRQMLVRTKLGAAQLIGAQAPLQLRPHDPDRLQALVPPEPTGLRERVEADINALFLLLAGVSLVIGAVGITNTTLVSVLERTGEIGLRRALGAGRHHIALQFLAESATLGTIGGLLGSCLGIIVVVTVAARHQWTAVIEPAAALPAPLLGTLTGLLGGFYPAVRGARVQPIQALNH